MDNKVRTICAELLLGMEQRMIDQKRDQRTMQLQMDQLMVKFNEIVHKQDREAKLLFLLLMIQRRSLQHLRVSKLLKESLVEHSQNSPTTAREASQNIPRRRSQNVPRPRTKAHFPELTGGKQRAVSCAVPLRGVMRMRGVLISASWFC